MVEMEIKVFEYLPDEAKAIRTRVFMEEQGFENEFDETDGTSTHFVMFEGGRPVATCRIFGGENPGEFVIGRIAVEKDCRGRSIGTDIIKAAEKAAAERGGKNVVLCAQCRAKEFYAKAGFTEFGEICYDEGRPHIWMRKVLV